MAKYQQYEEYKNTGSKWVPEIPIHWEPILFKRVIDQIKDGTHGTHARVNEGFPFLSAKNVLHKGIEISDSESMISEKDYKEITANGFPKKDDLLITCVGTIGRTCVYEFDEPYAFQRSVAFLRLSELAVPKFYKYFVESKTYQSQLEANSKASAQSGVYMGDLVSTSTVLPPKDEQIKIANFLDHETAQIDTLIDKQQTLIQLLKEKRQAVISHAVTKGLNPDAPMKDSGVEWLGEIPEHWDVVKLKRLVSFSQGVQVDLGLQKHEEFDKSVKFLRIENYTQGSSDYRFINSTLSQGKLVNRDELVMVRYGASAGYVGSGLEGALANNLFKISPTTNTITNNFLSSFLKNSYNYFQKEMSGSAMPALNFSMVEDLIITLPPIYEQKNIADYLDEIQNHFDYLTACAEQAIQLMQERRTALISAAVTGKIDVRGWVAPE